MNMKRTRGRNFRSNGQGGGSGGGGGPVRHQSNGNAPMNRNHVFDSSGPDLRIRGTAQQLSERYLQLGRDATGAADRVMAESYFQHAEHYFRILNAMNQAAQQSGQQPVPQQGGYQGGQGAGQNGQPQQRRYENQSDLSNDSEDGDDGQDGDAEQPIVETRPIAITAGAPEERD
jgi:hypothetical protein